MGGEAMKVRISQEQMDKLVEAARLAREPGACRYVSGGEASCVIGQLAVLHGALIKRIQSATEDGSKAIDAVSDYQMSKGLKLGGWDREGLKRIQKAWDRRCSSEDEARQHLFNEIQHVFEVAQA